MHFRLILTGALALMLLAGGSAVAQERGLLPKLGLPKLFGQKEKSEVQLVQSGDPRITALEEQIRSLSGRVEELNFQILQMQDQMRKMQEDNEFRFQELEQRRSDAGGKPRATASGQAPETARAAPKNGSSAAVPAPSGEVAAGEGAGDPGTAPGPKTFGTITFDGSGKATGGSVGETPPGAAADEDGRRRAAGKR